MLGHSERRQYFGESDRALAAKVPAALAASLAPILCVGESEEERDAGDTERRLRHQVQEALADVPAEQLAQVTIAYEPLWAIGTGRVAEPEQAQEADGVHPGADRRPQPRGGAGRADPLRRIGQA